MYPKELKQKALRMLAEGCTYSATSKILGIGQESLRSWNKNQSPASQIEKLTKEVAQLKGLLKAHEQIVCSTHKLIREEFQKEAMRIRASVDNQIWPLKQVVEGLVESI